VRRTGLWSTTATEPPGIGPDGGARPDYEGARSKLVGGVIRYAIDALVGPTADMVAAAWTGRLPGGAEDERD